jgi:hypothetical protein
MGKKSIQGFGQNHLEDPHAVGKIILKWILKKQDVD